MQIKKVTLHKLFMKLKSPFETSFGLFKDREFFVIEVEDETGEIGFGESVAFALPLYNEETNKTVKHVLEDFLIPLAMDKPIHHPDELSERFKTIKRNYMAKSAIEGAIWDLYAKRRQQTLAETIGGVKKEIEVGISIGIQDSIEELLKIVDGYVKQGYKRMKIKIKPGRDYELIRKVREKFPNISIMVDANSAYTLDDFSIFAKLDTLDLMMIEQPLAHDDIIDHAKLQAKINTPICLDESIHSLEDAKKAIELGSCKIINIKVGRVGGITEAKKIHDYCQKHGIDVWCGGMLESGIGRAHNVAISTLAQFTLPGDTAGSSRYWEEDIVDPEIEVRNGVISVQDSPGIGHKLKRSLLESLRTEMFVIQNKKMREAKR
ncbi:o-succinylbenzoate synthase [Bacillus horti]|uniref:o-succinylbenzoate synthase n=1 Tax=Caldalkalibacillus horti TaxID=77523 RepID=UPI0027D7AAE8|nr:o-succinylbenzoate synthase [Bacillus horti]